MRLTALATMGAVALPWLWRWFLPMMLPVERLIRTREREEREPCVIRDLQENTQTMGKWKGMTALLMGALVNEETSNAAKVAWEAGKPLVIEEIEVALPLVMEVNLKLLSAFLCHPDICFWQAKELEPEKFIVNEVHFVEINKAFGVHI
ncbi:hypothetical protein F0562_005767 [Nyssa sinensis]|uniref:alcohol dehydrogenase n=1 Tax=Nyssa sinensis TaxID=561372 RepID=A0A5J5ALD9_9ASTE|nr:hypothetical protein F0562_005767 [Nyssa sinensis]